MSSRPGSVLRSNQSDDEAVLAERSRSQVGDAGPSVTLVRPVRVSPRGGGAGGSRRPVGRSSSVRRPRTHAARENGGSFNGRQPVKKKRKSRTAFTNHQIFELEKRFLYQKYLSPADRDEIAQSLGLTNAQVITWFQNRRAKLKRDMEELKKDMDAAKIHTIHKTLLDNIQDLSSFKKDIHKTASGP
ncbi:conserved hypothetical protein [Ixodes scapularis]|uniref:Homeobox domain-containing protein n=1 Tax=Ixodes scapularis TaxID=6945 RepID=B7Q718_IXOSC|nr:conserved hypothetical protein [Ixodes scapularis]|eukprot:XP_002412074.1 conserved hypothetical protein [Ixodes scapularis]